MSIADKATQKVDVAMTVNGKEQSAVVVPRLTLADFLRTELGLTGTHVGCEHGVCGACTVLVDGVSTRSCLMLACQAADCEITTIDGLADGGRRHPLQQAFLETHAFQCGFCTPGFMMAALELLRDNCAPTEEEVRAAVSGNLCRCTGYQGIVDGIMLAAERLR